MRVSLGFGARQRSAGGIASRWTTRGGLTLGVRELGFLAGFFFSELVDYMTCAPMFQGATNMGSAGRSLRGRKMAQGHSGGTSPSHSDALSSSKFGK